MPLLFMYSSLSKFRTIALTSRRLPGRRRPSGRPSAGAPVSSPSTSMMLTLCAHLPHFHRYLCLGHVLSFPGLLP